MTTPKKTYSGAYSRRRYSNLSTASGAFGTSGVNPGTHSTGFVLNAYAANPAMGTVVANVVQSSGAASGKSPVADFAAGANATGRSYAAGTVVEVWAKPVAGYRFVSWNSDLSGVRQSNSVRITMNRDVTLVASFERVSTSYTLNVAWDGSMGRVTASGSGMDAGRMSATPGSQVSLEATPKDGYVFKRWEVVHLAGNVQDNTSRRITITMPAHDLSLTAVFAKSADVPGGGGGTPGGGTSDDPGHNVYETPAVNVYPASSVSLVDSAVAFAKKWWWALAIAAWLYYDSRKGGRS